MQIIYKILVLIVLAATGFLLTPFIPHLLMKVNLLDTANVPDNYLEDVFTKTSFVWMGSLAAGLISLFIEQKWRIIFLLCPLILPSLFVIFYTLLQL